MLFWVAIALMTGGTVLALVLPLLRTRPAGPSAAARKRCARWQMRSKMTGCDETIALP